MLVFRGVSSVTKIAGDMHSKKDLELQIEDTRWWFETFYIFTPTWGK